MANVKGRNVRIEIATGFGSAIPVTAVTNANPAVATAASHGLANNVVGYFDLVTGMEQLNGQAARVKNTATNTFELQGLNTSNMGVYTGGNFYPASGWTTFAETTAYTIGGGAGTKLNATRLIDNLTQEEQGNLAAQTLSMRLLAQTVPSTAGALLDSIAQATGKALARVTFADGAVRIAYGEPSMAGEDVAQGALGTGTIDFTVKGFVLKLAA